MKKDNSWIWIAAVAIIFLGFNAYQQHQANIQQCINRVQQNTNLITSTGTPAFAKAARDIEPSQIADCKK
jgi:hypothetical protein